MQRNIEHHAIRWLKQRGITDEVIRRFSLSVIQHSHMGESIRIPVMGKDGIVLFNKYRRSPLSDTKPKYLYDAGGEMTLYGWHEAKSKQRILITEGELDTLVAWSVNIPAVCSTGGAQSFNSEWSLLFADKEVFLCFDNDKAGGAGMARVHGYIPHAKIVLLPDTPAINDLSDYVSRGGDIRALLSSARIFQSELDIREDRTRRTAMWASTYFHDAVLEREEKKRAMQTRHVRNTRHDTDIERAKEYPIGNLISFNNQSKSLCLWHAEKTPSLHWYKKTNKVYCFGACGKHGDAIDVYRTLHNASFKEAVRRLS